MSILGPALKNVGFLKPEIKIERFNPGAKKFEVTPTERRIHLEKLKRFYRQDIALHVKAKEVEQPRRTDRKKD